MKILVRTTLAVAAMAFTASTASAQFFNFSTSGCFGIACGAFGSPVTHEFNGSSSVTFNGVTNAGGNPSASGFLALANIGSFSFANSAGSDYLFEDLAFRLRFQFSDPEGATATPDFVSGELEGRLKKNASTGKIDWDFGANSLDFLYHGGSFRVTVSNAEDNDGFHDSHVMSGSIDCSPGTNAPCPPVTDPIVEIEQVPTLTTPEPSTYLLMASGLAGLGIAARRRRNA